MSTSIRPVCRLARQPIRLPGLVAVQIDGERQPVIDVGRAIDQPTCSCSRRNCVSVNCGEPWRMRSWLSREPLRTRIGKVRGEISA